MGVPSKFDRYPAKMVGRLASEIIGELDDCELLFDPFCGSGTLIRIAQDRGIASVGFDVNPYAALLARVKTEGFDSVCARELWAKVVSFPRTKRKLSVNLENRELWFHPATLEMLGNLRYLVRTRSLNETPEARAILLSLALAARPCSRADQRSPKPFISKRARKLRYDVTFDPFAEVGKILTGLCNFYGERKPCLATVYCNDAATTQWGDLPHDRPTHIVTSPPYLNAQDYFRSSKLELALLDGLMPFSISGLKHRFIGSERGVPRRARTDDGARQRRKTVPGLAMVECRRPEKALIVHHYFARMAEVLKRVADTVRPGGRVVLVCGDNLVAGVRIPTWKVLNKMLLGHGLSLLNCKSDRIESRALAPARCGHKGLIKEEWISVFAKSG